MAYLSLYYSVVKRMEILYHIILLVDDPDRFCKRQLYMVLKRRKKCISGCLSIPDKYLKKGTKTFDEKA
jgi:hypothetical protein